ncbi:MAG: phage terminase small subunit gpNu1 [Betaproteobacteria bacterium]|nr:phage terminase small subunit gpNu1 [Betaproteobacteria bacterium]
MSRLVNKARLAELLDTSERALTDWQEQGMPIEHRGERGESHEYDVARVFAWYAEREVRKVSRETQNDRYTRLKADMLERELAERDGSLVPVEQIAPVWNGRVLAGAAFILGRHSRLAGLLEATPGVEAKRALLKLEDAAFLTKLGVNGERYTVELQALLDSLPADVVEAFHRRLEPGAPAGAERDMLDQSQEL